MAVRRILTMILCGAIAVPVHAAPRSDPTAGRAVFTGAATPSATSIGLDPAAIGLGLVDFVFYAAVTTVLDQTSIDRRTLDVASGALSSGGSVSDAQVGPGGVLAAIWHPSSRLALGFEAQLPPPEQFPTGHDELRYHTLGIGERDYIATVAVSLRVTNSFYFGASLAHQNTTLRLRYARDTALASGYGPNGLGSDCGGMACGLSNPLATEIYAVDARTPHLAAQNLKVTLGTVIEVAPDVWLGLAYHTPPGFSIETELTGTMDVTRAPRDGGGMLHGGSTVDVSYPASIDGEIRARLPADLELHLGGRWQDLSRMSGYDVRGYGSTFRNAGIPEWMVRARGLHDSFALWGGIEQIDTGDHTFSFGGRLGFERSSIPDERISPTTIEPGSATLDLGAQARLGSWVVQLSYGFQYYLPVSVDRSAFDPRYQIECIESGFDYTTAGCAASRNGYAIESAAGDYHRFGHALRLGFRYELP